MFLARERISAIFLFYWKTTFRQSDGHFQNIFWHSPNANSMAIGSDERGRSLCGGWSYFAVTFVPLFAWLNDWLQGAGGGDKEFINNISACEIFNLPLCLSFSYCATPLYTYILTYLLFNFNNSLFPSFSSFFYRGFGKQGFQCQGTLPTLLFILHDNLIGHLLPIFRRPQKNIQRIRALWCRRLVIYEARPFSLSRFNWRINTIETM